MGDYMGKAILCYGSSNVWGFIPGSFDSNTWLAERYSKSERWPGILETELSPLGYSIIEEGLNGRTTAFDDEVAKKPYRNGLTQLPVCLESHYPLDLVILSLGINDLKTQYQQSAESISENMRVLVQLVKNSNKGPHRNPPKVLLIAPQLLRREGLPMLSFNEDSLKKSAALPALLKKIAEEEKIFFIETTDLLSSPKDGIHLDAEGNKKLALRVKDKILTEIFGGK
jgi:lysophospholipase L1-like esterase